MRSFTKVEKSISSNFRARLSQAEDIPDVAGLFCTTMATVFGEAIPEADVRTDHISFYPAKPPHYAIEKDLRNKEEFKETWKNSDLKAITGRFAEACKKRCRHLGRHPEKTNAKIRNLSI